MTEQTRQNPSSLNTALRLLKAFTAEEPEFSIDDLAQKMGIGRSTTHRLLGTLASEGFIARDPHSKKYRLGASILASGNVIVSGLHIHRTALPVLEDLMQKSGESAHLGILSGKEVVYLHRGDSPYPVPLRSHLGKRNPAHCTSTGQVLLAYQTPAVIDSIIESGLTPFTEHTITDPEQFREKLHAIRKQGYSVSIEEFHAGVTSVAAPILRPKGKGPPLASVTLAGPVQRIHAHTLPKLIRYLLNASHEISRRLSER
ncbi:IclR family transcriptional regulator [Ferviditalea candida]|uniref:IclR family transcriptional regulator n=1 Tax=Ferviditalea candida TaxID=3108399 RepID=A0ABU5ZFK4_9BACL|nr:IclR family transcriptional regulator [Paenibacillaceae bacterium T2]